MVQLAPIATQCDAFNVPDLQAFHEFPDLLLRPHLLGNARQSNRPVRGAGLAPKVLLPDANDLVRLLEKQIHSQPTEHVWKYHIHPQVVGVRQELFLVLVSIEDVPVVSVPSGNSGFADISIMDGKNYHQRDDEDSGQKSNREFEEGQELDGVIRSDILVQ